MPGLTRVERHLEAEPAVGGNSLTRSTRHRNCDCAAKIAVRVGSANPLPPLGPFGGDLAAAHDAARFHLEDVGEIAHRKAISS